MPAPTVYRSTDVGAPVLTSQIGSLQRLLDAVLVNGYGATASTVLTSDNVNVADGDTVTIGGRVYTFKATLDTQGAADQVLIGANADATLLNLSRALNLSGNYATEYIAIYMNMDVTAGSVIAHTLTLTSRVTGTAGNAVTTTTASAGTSHLSFTGATLLGGTVTKSSLGWTKEYTGAPTPTLIAATQVASVNGASTATSGTMPTSALLKPGDLVMFYVTMYDTVAGGTVVNTPAGYTLLHATGSFSNRTNGDKGFIFYRYLTAADFSTTFSFANSAGNSSNWMIARYVYRNVEQGSVPIVAGQINPSVATTITPTSPSVVTPAGYYGIVSIVFSNYTGAGGATQPTGFTDPISFLNGAGGCQISYADKWTVGAASGTLGPYVWGAVGNTGGAYVVTLALKPTAVKMVAVYRPPAGARPYLQIAEVEQTGLVFVPYAATEGYESMTDALTGTNPFRGALVGFQKSFTTDATTRPWVIAGDDRTFYMFIATGAIAAAYDAQFGFGEFYSYIPGEASKQILLTGSASSAANSALNGGFPAASTGTGAMPRTYVGVYGPVISATLLRDTAMWNDPSAVSAAASYSSSSVWAFPNPDDGGVYMSRNDIFESGVGNARVLRGRLRGLFSPLHSYLNFTDGEIYVGTDAFAGRSFAAVRNVNLQNVSFNRDGCFLVETTDWEKSS